MDRENPSPALMRAGACRWRLAAGALTLLGATQMAAGQTVGRAVESSGNAMVWLVSVGVAAIVLLPGFINPKRSHRM